MFRSGEFVTAHIEETDEPQVQPNGVALTLSAVFEQLSPGRVRRDGKTIGDRCERNPTDGIYRLDPGGYVVRYGERIQVPRGHVGFLYPRSSLLRNSCMLDTAVWDAGYEGRGEGLLEVYHPVEIERGARIAQFVLGVAAHETEYDGNYQGENLDNR